MHREINQIHRKLKMLHHAFEERRNRQLLQYNLTSSQMDVLFYLKFCEGEVHQRDIEKSFGLKNPTVTGILNRLEEKGFIVRKTRQEDKRFRLIELTENSNRIVAEICEDVWRTDDRIYNCMSREERERFSELLDRILNSLSEL